MDKSEAFKFLEIFMQDIGNRLILLMGELLLYRFDICQTKIQ